MKLIIDIDEDLYEMCRDCLGEADNIEGIIANGTPLPQNHGRLIDADYLREDFKASKKISFAERMDISCIVDHAPTIIEADKVESEVKNEYGCNENGAHETYTRSL